jgi:glycosyltransferase involved in cell wall biosynthesis
VKIAMLTTVGDRCGIAYYTRALVGALEALPDTQVEVIPIHEGKQPAEHYKEQAERFNAPDVDVVHIQHEHSFWGGILPRSSAYWQMRYLIQKPVVLTAHTTYTLAEMLKVKTERRPHKRLIKQLLLLNKNYVDSVQIAPFTTAYTMVHTAAARNALIERGAKPGYVTIMPTGIPAPLPAPTGGQSFRERFGLERRRLITLFGYITPNKGYELTLDLMPSLPPEVTFVIAGGTRAADTEPFRAELEARIARSGLADRVLVTGFLTDEEVAEAMEASEIVLAPHTQATGSYSITLPLTHGRPILASDLDCFREIHARMDCIELFRAGDLAHYRERLLGLLCDPQRQATLAANARRYAQRYSWPRVAAMTRKVYATAIEIYQSRSHHSMHSMHENTDNTGNAPDS